MHKRRKSILGPVYSVAPAEGGAPVGGAGAAAPALPTGVAQGSAVAHALNDGAAAPAAEAAKPAGYVPVAEVAQERAKRHELETKFTALEQAQTKQLDAFKAALGLKPEQTPEQAAQLMQQQANEHRTALTHLSVHQLATAAGADPAKLLDSNSFLSSIANLAPTDHAGIASAITKAVEANNLLAAKPVQRPGAGARDAAHAGSNDGNSPSISDLLRGAAGRG